MTYVAVTPESLLKASNTTVKIVPIEGDLIVSLEQALQNTKIVPTNDDADIRWGAIFYDADNKEVHSIYLNRRYPNVVGNTGVIDGQKVSVNNALVDWLESRFIPKERPPSHQ
jgi:hypothetical protein